MVEYSIGVCYGVIISDKMLMSINELFPDGNSMDDFSDSYLRQLNAWTGGDWFLGLSKTFDGAVININEIRWDKAELEELEQKLNEYHIIDLIDWFPQKYIIQFCY